MHVTCVAFVAFSRDFALTCVCLCVLQGVSAAVAHALVTRYGTLAAFVRHLRAMDRLSAQVRHLLPLYRAQHN